MGGGFWPTLPLKMPYSEGVPHWWDPAWWIFQIVVMSILLLTLRKVAMSIDQAEKVEKEQRVSRRRSPGTPPPNIPG
ncbi:hypothetical protein SAMN00768000_1516 [Sulfobacillus thermosulfidooxidans DSM 9293]|uniref:Uncharacterized protein n=1 Tax=Sulfobacillus thermosulfidooxidans (strain DSM 9293 / VKM B-1269 / AT-1) TaxID=929705 RepID=A0A1W1WD03_SULTA|nr:hypothetical protein [Sulfobacillus thermosulfidooxidans]SMC04198.1 hypothetical protein SAMN00768000_1516 [Sulfobacillus thermosulfidooxidans DSM 9293]